MLGLMENYRVMENSVGHMGWKTEAHFVSNLIFLNQYTQRLVEVVQIKYPFFPTMDWTSRKGLDEWVPRV